MAYLALLAYLVFVFIRPQEFWVPLIDVPTVKFSLILATVFLFLEKHRRFDLPQNTLLFCLLPVILLSGLTNGWLGGGIVSAEKYLTAILLPFLMIPNLINTPRKQHGVLLLLLLSAMLMVNDGMEQKASAIGVGWSGAALSQGTRITYLGIFNDPNDLGMFFVMILPAALYYFRKVGFWLKPVFIAVTGYLLYGIYLTNSRGTLLGTMAMLAAWFYLKYGAVKSLRVGLLAAPILFVVMGKFRAIDSEEASAAGRLDAWYEGFQMLFWKPLFGVGMGEFMEHHILTAHNSFVLVFSELGLIGYFIWISFLVCTMCALLKLWFDRFPNNLISQVDPVESDFARLFTMSFLGYLVTCFFLSRAYTPMLYIFSAMAAATFYRATSITDNPKQWIKLPFSEVSTYVWKTYIGSFIAIFVVVKLFI